MKFTASTLRLSMDLAERIGTVTEAHLYNSEFITVDGETNKGEKFILTLNMEKEEAKKDGD